MDLGYIVLIVIVGVLIGTGLIMYTTTQNIKEDLKDHDLF